MLWIILIYVIIMPTRSGKRYLIWRPGDLCDYCPGNTRFYSYKNFDYKCSSCWEYCVKNGIMTSKEFGDKCTSIYLLFGDLSENELANLYHHPKVKSMLSFTKGEGYGRPLCEFTLTGKPIIVSKWSDIAWFGVLVRKFFPSLYFFLAKRIDA